MEGVVHTFAADFACKWRGLHSEAKRRVSQHVYTHSYCINIILSYRTVPTFGKSTIRSFSNNASGMKKLAARDYEDLLQVLL